MKQRLYSAPDDPAIVETDEDYVVDLGVSIVDVFGPGVTISLPINPQPGTRVRIIASGGDVMIDGGGFRVLGDSFVREDTFGSYLFSRSGKWIPIGVEPPFTNPNVDVTIRGRDIKILANRNAELRAQGKLLIGSRFDSGQSAFDIGASLTSEEEVNNAFQVGNISAKYYLQMLLTDPSTVITGDYQGVVLQQKEFGGDPLVEFYVTQHTNFAIAAKRQYPTVADYGGGRGIMFFGQANVIPTTPPLLGIQLWVDPVDGWLKYRKPDGTVVVLSG